MTVAIFRFSNRFYVSDCNEIARISVGEKIDDKEELHTHLVMVKSDVLALRDLLIQLYPPEKGTIQ